MKAPRICVVGAGMAGLRCADLLLSSGFLVTVFEARNRIGGRCHQSSFLGPMVDLGCNQIHGTDHNPFVKLAKDTGTVTYLPEDVHSIFLKDGRHIQGEEARNLWTAVENMVAEGIKYSRNNSTNIREELSLMDWFSEKVGELDVSDTRKDRMRQVVQDWGGYTGESIETQSLKNLWMETSMPGDNLMVATTYSKILERVAEPVLGRAELHLSEEVVRIANIPDATGTGVQVLLETASGLSKTCDHVVITAPHGWLRQNKAAFTPSMPQELSEAIDSIAYSRLEKVFVHFPTAWWEGNQDGMGDADRFASETLWTTPEYAQKTNPGRWNQEIFSFSALPSDIAHPTLLFYIYGDNSKLLTESLQGLSLDSKEYYDALVSFFEPYYALLPNYNKSLPFCKPSKCLSTDWGHDKFAGHGAYTHFALPLKDGAKTIAIIRNGMGMDRHIWFAGEHTAPDIALSTVVGAYWSGERAAKSIQEFYDSGKSSFVPQRTTRTRRCWCSLAGLSWLTSHARLWIRSRRI